MKKLAAPSNSPAPSTVPTTKPARSFLESPVRTRRGLWPLADGYLESNVLGGFFRGLIWFVGLFMAFIIVSGASKVARAHMPVSLLIQFVLLQVPRLIVFTIPSSLLFGTVSTFTEMSSRGEITALMAGGMSLRRMLRAPLVSAVVLAGLAFWLQESIVPQCELKRGEIASGALQNAKATQLFPLIHKDDNGKVDRIIQADDFDAKRLVLTHPDIRVYREDDSAIHVKAQSAHWDKEKREWVFVSGFIAHEPKQIKVVTPDSPGYNILPFDHITLGADFTVGPTLSMGSSLISQLKDHNFEMVSLAQLGAYRATLLDSLHQLQQDPKATPKDITTKRAEVRAATFGINDKIATPLIVIAMVLIGAPLGVRPQRTAAAGLALGLSMMVLLGYYLVWTLVSQWSKGGGGQPVIAAYFPFVVLVGLGTFLTWKKS